MQEEAAYLTLKQLTGQHFVPAGWYRDIFPTHFNMQWHLHQQFEIMYCEKGAFSFEYMNGTDTDTEKYESASVPEKHFILLNSGYYHRIKIEVNDTQIFNVELLPVNGYSEDEKGILKSVSPVARELFSVNAQLEEIRDKNMPFYIFHDSQEIGETMKKIVEELNADSKPERNLTARLLLLKLFLDISKCSSNSIVQPIKLTYVRKALLFMQHNFASPVSVEDVAAAVKISPAYLQRLFQTELQEGVHAALTKIRIKNAKNLLKTTSLSNAEIAKLSGFHSREQLIYAFRTAEGCSPRDYRLSCKKKKMRTYPWPHDVELPD